MPCIKSIAGLCYITCKVEGNIFFFLCPRAHGSFPSCKWKLQAKRGKANATGRLTVLCGKCCVSGAETTTVPQCVPVKGKREWATEGVRGGDFLFMTAFGIEGVLSKIHVTSRVDTEAHTNRHSKTLQPIGQYWWWLMLISLSGCEWAAGCMTVCLWL